MIRFIRENSFGIVFSQVNGQPTATHLPLLVDTNEDDGIALLGHFAKANPHWRELDGADVFVVFQGPHAYISPLWYVEKDSVPTWNYVAVHVHGKCKIMRDEQGLHSLLRKMVQFYEPDSPLLEHLDESFYIKLENAIVGFEIEVTVMEGKSKLSQNKSPVSIQAVIEGLGRSQDYMAHEVAKLMRNALDASGKE